MRHARPLCLLLGLGWAAFACQPPDDPADVGIVDEEAGAPDDPAADQGPPVDAASGPAPDCGPPIDDVEGAPTGLVACGDGAFDRVIGVACPPSVEGVDYTRCPPDAMGGDCRADADCGDGARCIRLGGDVGDAFCGCRRLCTSDDDCGAREACLCRTVIPLREGVQRTLSHVSTCRRADCRAATDCEGERCGFDPLVDTAPFACRTAADACFDDTACATPHERCAYDPNEGRWRCRPYDVAEE